MKKLFKWIGFYLAVAAVAAAGFVTGCYFAYKGMLIFFRIG